jgi:hypothetical protein
MTTLIKKQYRPFHQLPYCCVPATLQWIFYRRGLDIMDQETIGAELGLRIPEKFRDIISNKKVDIVPDDHEEPGTRIFEERFSVPNFFNRFNIPLHFSEQYNFKTEKELEDFILNNLKKDQDIILRFNDHIFKENGGVGHFALIVGHDKNKVLVGDPDPPFFKEASLKDILFSISDKIDGEERGLFIVSAKK